VAEGPEIPPPRGFVNDFADVLDPVSERKLEALIEELRAKTTAEIAIVTVRSTRPLSAFDYAMKIAETWQPGARERDNGVVFLVAVEDREMFILTGYGVEGVLPDGRVGEIRDRLVLPHFRRGDYAAGISAGTAAIATILAKEYGITLTGMPERPLQPPPAEPELLAAASLLLLLLFLLMLAWNGVLPIAFSRRSGGPFFGGGFGGGGLGGPGGEFGGFGGGGAGGRW